MEVVPSYNPSWHYNPEVQHKQFVMVRESLRSSTDCGCVQSFRGLDNDHDYFLSYLFQLSQLSSSISFNPTYVLAVNIEACE
jgi:hypothetical protein